MKCSAHMVATYTLGTQEGVSGIKVEAHVGGYMTDVFCSYPP